MAEVSIFSFFAGCGILDLAFETTNYDIVFVNEFIAEFMNGYRYARQHLQIAEPLYGYSNNSAERYSQRRGKRSLLKMMEQERAKGKLIGFIGGPPCPDFSVGGKNAGATGENGRLTRVYFDLICKCQPDFFVFENVKGLIKTEKHKKFYHEMKCKVRGNQYVIADKLLNSLEYGVPQSRERIIMIGIKNSLIVNPERINPANNELVFNWNQHRIYQIEGLNNLNWPTTTPFVENEDLVAPTGIPLELTVEHWFVHNHVENHPNGQDNVKYIDHHSEYAGGDGMGILECASIVSVSRGYDYYKENKVISFSESSANIFSAKVAGSSNHPYSVELHIDHPRKSKCNCPHTDGQRSICKHIVATYFAVLPEEAERYYAEAMAYEEEEEKRAEELSDKVCNHVQHMKKSELQQALLQLLFSGPEWQYNRFVRENGLDNDW